MGKLGNDPTGKQEIISDVSTIDGIVDDIKVVTDAIPDAGVMSSIAQGTDLATLDGKVALDSTVAKEATLSTVDGKVDTIDAFHDVPAQDSADNVVMSDVIGNKTDTHNGTSIYGKATKLDEHFHNEVFLYPSLAGSVTLTKAAGAWAACPTPTEIIPVNTITEDFDLHFMNVSGISANGEYSICLYQGLAGAETLLGVYGAVRNAVQSQEGTRPIITPFIPANSRISAAISSENAAADTLNIKVEGHTY